MKKPTTADYIFWAVIGIMILFMIFMLISVFYDIVHAEELEIPINQFPFWAVSTSGDSTFQTVQILKCYEIFPNGQRELLGYMVAVDSSGVRIYEGEPKYFSIWIQIRTELGYSAGFETAV